MFATLLKKTGRLLLFGLGFLLSACYLWSYLCQSQNNLRTVVFGLFLAIMMTALVSWRAAVFAFIFCSPLFNTLPTILGLVDVWPPFNFNLLFLSALGTAALVYRLERRPFTLAHRHLAIQSSPFDPLWLMLVLLAWSTAVLGVVSFNNIFCPGFFQELPARLTSIPFASQTNRYLGLARAFQFTCMAAAFYAAFSIMHTRKDAYSVLKCLLVSSSLVCLFAIWQAPTGSFLVGIQKYFGRINATFNGPDSAATFFIAIVLLSISFFWQAKRAAGYVFASFLFVASIFGLLLTGSRTPTFSLVISFGLIVFLLLLKAGKLAAAVPIVGGLLAVFLFVAPGNNLKLPGSHLWKTVQEKRILQGIKDLKLNQSALDRWFSMRSYHWYAARNAVKSAPVFGHGLGTLDKLYPKFKYRKDDYKSAFAHNLYLDYFAEAGSLGLIVSLLFYLTAILMSIRLWMESCGSRRLKSLGMALTGVFTAFFCCNLFSSSFFYVFELMVFQAVLFAVTACLFCGTFPGNGESVKSKAKRIFHLLWATPARRALLCLAVLAVLGVFSWRFRVAAEIGRRQYFSCEPYDLGGRILEYGIHHYEFDKAGNKFARTERNVYKPILCSYRYLQIYLRAEHPDADRLPVPATFTINGEIAGSLVLSNRVWNSFILDLATVIPATTNSSFFAENKKLPISLGLVSGRMWNPLKWNPKEHDIDYGIDLGTILQGLY